VRSILLLLLTGTLGCAVESEVAPRVNGPAPIVETPVSEVGGVNARYSLTLVNGAPPPSKSPVGAGEWDYDGAKYELVSATLAFNANGTFVESWIHRRINESQSDLIRQDFIGKYNRTSETTLRIGTASEATLITNGLVWYVGTFILTYELTK
jgi:hypothetical protein